MRFPFLVAHNIALRFKCAGTAERVAFLQLSLDKVRANLQAEIDKGSERDKELIALYETREVNLLEELKIYQQKPGVHR